MKTKNNLFKVSLCFMAYVICCFTAFSEKKEEGPYRPIGLGINTEPQPRTLVQDIEAYHTNTMVYLTFNENLGQANIVITNANTGAQVETSVPTNCSNVQVDISSLGQGDFTILIICEGSSYYGSFHNRTEL